MAAHIDFTESILCSIFSV